jgi:hypothetical protein
MSDDAFSESLSSAADIRSASAALERAKGLDQQLAALDHIAMLAEGFDPAEIAARRPREEDNTPFQPIEKSEMSNDPFGQSAGSPESYIQAIMDAPVGHAKEAALARYEDFAKRQVSGGSAAPGSGGAAPSFQRSSEAAPPANIDAAIKEAFQRATQGEDGYIRAQGKADLERLYEQQGAATGGDNGAGQGFEAPRSPAEYHFTTTPGVDVQNHAGVGELKNALFEAGVPAPIANQAFLNASRMAGEGVLATPEAHASAVSQCRQTLDRTYGADAVSIAKDGATYLNALADRDPRLNEPVAVMLADPWAVATAATMYRAGGRARR